MSGNEPVEVSVQIMSETEKALKVYDGMTYIWLPKSQITYDEDNDSNRATIITMPLWLAKAKGLV